MWSLWNKSYNINYIRLCNIWLDLSPQPMSIQAVMSKIRTITAHTQSTEWVSFMGHQTPTEAKKGWGSQEAGKMGRWHYQSKAYPSHRELYRWLTNYRKNLKNVWRNKLTIPPSSWWVSECFFGVLKLWESYIKAYHISTLNFHFFRQRSSPPPTITDTGQFCIECCRWTWTYMKRNPVWFQNWTKVGITANSHVTFIIFALNVKLC